MRSASAPSIVSVSTSAPRAVARHARLLDDLARAAALRAGALHGEEAALREADLSPATAPAAGDRLRAGLRAAAAAGLARGDARHVERHVLAKDRLLEL